MVERGDIEPRILYPDSSSLIPVPCFPIQGKGFGNQEFTKRRTSQTISIQSGKGRGESPSVDLRIQIPEAVCSASLKSELTEAWTLRISEEKRHPILSSDDDEDLEDNLLDESLEISPPFSETSKS